MSERSVSFGIDRVFFCGLGETSAFSAIKAFLPLKKAAEIAVSNEEQLSNGDYVSELLPVLLLI